MRSISFDVSSRTLRHTEALVEAMRRRVVKRFIGIYASPPNIKSAHTLVTISQFATGVVERYPPAKIV